MEDCLKEIFDLSLRYLMHRMRTKREMVDYLKKHLYDSEVIDQCISMLCAYNYIDDEEYCKHYIEYSKEKLKSMKQIYYELMQKGVDKHIITKYLIDYDENEIIFKLLNKKSLWERYRDEHKIINYLLRKGFQYENIKKVLKEAT
ncbi:regulatory protein [Caldanaerobius fijiensis DSM 17918]|uniref:Regulatory protein RecX n=1 Tax=Caldanaerobius fijiensis DSM 17918 TaxID=1121256 RepID=A0A1M4YBW1_9THEO|nr:RecX family transcriptional regulator [Caldanaerobius fijiensis]SHF03225.1 regulatory protein [Caldanaerobius fijiensis DSM 17918]